MLQTLSLNWDYIAAETDRLGIREFEEKNRALATHLFGEDDITEEDKEILQYMVDSGSFGTIQNLVNNKVDKNGGSLGGRFRYIFIRLILPMDVVKSSYPTFYNHIFLLPFLPLYRLLRGNAGNRKRLRAELKALMQPKDNGKRPV